MQLSSVSAIRVIHLPSYYTMTEQAGSSSSESNIHKRKRAAYSCTECTKGKAKVGQCTAKLKE
jgi:hypothetical protein